jgi:hypothetical protein
MIPVDYSVGPFPARTVLAGQSQTDGILLVQDLHVTGINATTGEILRDLILDPRKDYQPTGRPPGPAKK